MEISPDLRSRGLLAQIQTWRHVCQTEHPSCRTTSAPCELPTRLIEVVPTSNPDFVRLRNTKGMVGSYAALTYCWGKTRQQTTTKETISDHLVRIPLRCLPAAIQDAVWLCRGLNIPYLWIDALCIIQNDAEDWKHEAASMAGIYGRSALTLSAPQSMNSDRGFAKIGTPEILSLPRLRWSLRASNITGTVTARHNTEGPYHSDVSDLTNSSMLDKSHSPWMRRGWTLQGWLLSPRILHCGSDRVWDCYQACISERRPDPTKGQDRTAVFNTATDGDVTSYLSRRLRGVTSGAATDMGPLGPYHRGVYV